MQTFEFIAWDTFGNRHAGVKQAGSEDDVIASLREENLTPVSIRTMVATDAPKILTVRYKRVRSQDLATFCWQLSTMLDGGLGITTAIQTVATEMDNRYFEACLRHISSMLESGKPISECVKEYPKVFNTLSCAMIHAGERGGSMTQSLQRLAVYYENRDKLARKVKGAMAYPIFVVVFIVLIVIALMTFIIPRFQTMFDMMHGKLPAFTKGFMAVYHGIASNAVYIMVGLAAVVLSAVLYGKTKSGHLRLGRIALAVPLFGKLKLQAFVAVFCKTLGTLLSSGVTVLDAFDILTNMTTNEVLRSGIRQTRERLTEGSSISVSMAASRFFPDVAVKMVQIGEQSGSLSGVLDKTSEYYERKVDAMISTLLGLMEPIMIISVGSIVLVVILAMYLPIFSMSANQ
jgi:type IV pilus assembly protein PilC